MDTLKVGTFNECITLTNIKSDAFILCEGLTKVTFEDPEDWSVNGNGIDVTNTSANAINLLRL